MSVTYILTQLLLIAVISTCCSNRNTAVWTVHTHTHIEVNEVSSELLLSHVLWLLSVINVTCLTWYGLILLCCFFTGPHPSHSSDIERVSTYLMWWIFDEWSCWITNLITWPYIQLYIHNYCPTYWDAGLLQWHVHTWCPGAMHSATWCVLLCGRTNWAWRE